MLCRNILITGCNRGIGLEMVKQLAGSSLANKIIATCRIPEKAGELQELVKKYPSMIHILKIDLTDEGSYEDFATGVTSIVGKEGLNLLLNNAGCAAKGSIDSVTWKEMAEILSVNTIAPLMLTKCLLPLLKDGAKYSQDGPSYGVKRAAVINITSKMGSMSDNGSGGYYSYRASKAALNAVTKSMSVDLKPYNMLVVSLHPGWVQTDMGGKNALITVEHCVGNILKLLSTFNEETNGQFLQYDGKTIEW